MSSATISHIDTLETRLRMVNTEIGKWLMASVSDNIKDERLNYYSEEQSRLQEMLKVAQNDISKKSIKK